VTFCEGYLGILPTLELWGKLFFLKLGTRAKGKPARCGTCIAVPRSGSSGTLFPKVTLTDLMKKWQDTYFYVSILDPAQDYLNLPTYVGGPPAGGRNNWGSNPGRCWLPSQTS
jgi:hypothetical protein